ncbi:glycosyltransferase family 4 protein [Rhabdothermincola sp.]|uniref:glycosyltransferase family 4 protein n=1 Tax=Rhabdothermincola sp. TaxID=2820405 RepID=UPI002FE2609B
MTRPAGRDRPRLIHVTTTDMSLDWLLGPQLRAFAEAGFEVFGASAPGPHVARLEQMGIGHVALRHATREMAPHRDALALAELLAVFRDLKPDIVHTHNPKPGVYGRIAARLAGVPVVVNTVHGLYALPEDPVPKRALVYALERLAAACSHAELLQNEEDLPVLRRLRVPAERLHLLGNGIDLERFDPATIGAATRERVRAELGVGPDEVLIGAVGRLVAEKGYVDLLDAFSLVRRWRPEARMVIVGPSDPDKGDALPPDLLAWAEREHGVRFLGHRDDVEQLYAAMDLYVLASRREGFPRSAMEAAAMGLPIVATDIRGCRQVVDHGVNGLLVRVGAVAALAEALAGMVADASRRQAMGREARCKALRDFDQQRVVSTTLDVYRRLLAARDS